MNFFPDLVIHNPFYLGDSIMLEPIATYLQDLTKSKIYIQCSTPDLFLAHPTIQGLPYGIFPEGDYRIINVAEALKPYEIIQKDNKSRQLIYFNKLQNLYDYCSIPYRDIKQPRLYLSDSEIKEVKSLRNIFGNKCIGVVMESRDPYRTYPYNDLLIKYLSKKYHTFVFGKGIEEHYHNLDKYPIISLSDGSIRNFMVFLSVVNIVITPDTGLAHLAGSLGRPMIVIGFKYFKDLYEPYEKCSYVYHEKSKTLSTISLRKILKTLDSQLPKHRYYITGRRERNRVLFVRFRGLGDLLLFLPVAATYKKKNKEVLCSLLTSPACKKLVSCSNVFDDVVGMDYNHETCGYPPVPDSFDYEPFDEVWNLINRIDFVPDSNKKHRSYLFAKAIELNEVDYSTDWKLKIPELWITNASEKILDYDPNRKLVGVQMDSKGLSRQWDANVRSTFITKCLDNDYQVVLMSDEKMDGFPSECFNVTGKLSIEDYVGMIKLSDVFVGPDSSGIHIAGCIDKPAIGLFGSIDPKLRISHYDTVYPLMGKVPCEPCNDWQSSICKDTDHYLACMSKIKSGDIFSLMENII